MSQLLLVCLGLQIPNHSRNHPLTWSSKLVSSLSLGSPKIETVGCSLIKPDLFSKRCNRTIASSPRILLPKRYSPQFEMGYLFQNSPLQCALQPHLWQCFAASDNFKTRSIPLCFFFKISCELTTLKTVPGNENSAIRPAAVWSAALKYSLSKKKMFCAIWFMQLAVTWKCLCNLTFLKGFVGMRVKIDFYILRSNLN